MSAGNAILPVTLTGFSAQCKGNFIQLSWKTTAETNSEQFVIQRSTNGTNWIKMGSVKAAGNSYSLSSYQYEDKSLMPAPVFYRLAQYDANSKIYYSPVIKTGCGVSTEFKVMPNPVMDIAKIVIGSNANNNGILLLYNANGQRVMQQAITLTSGLNEYQLNMTLLAKGTYQLLFTSKAEASQNTKIIKQ